MKTISKLGGGAKCPEKKKQISGLGPGGVLDYWDYWDWYIYLHLVDYYMVNVGNYTIHGCYGFLT